MLPADQGLDGQDLPGPQIELRLVVEYEGAAVDRQMELLGQAHLILFLVQALDEAHERDVPELGPVHGDIRAPDQPGAVGGVGRGDRDADAGADAHVHRVQKERLARLWVRRSATNDA